MGFDINEVELVGNVGKNPELIGKNKNVLVFPFATNETWTDKKTGEPVSRVTWHSICIFGKSIEKAVENIKKGDRLLIRGSLFQSKSDKDGEIKYYTNINCKKWWPLSYLINNSEEDKEKKYHNSYKEEQLHKGQEHSVTNVVNFEDDEIPF